MFTSDGGVSSDEVNYRDSLCCEGEPRGAKVGFIVYVARNGMIVRTLDILYLYLAGDMNLSFQKLCII